MAEMTTEVVPEIAELAGTMIEWRHDIHAHPELGFQETRTADFVASELTAYGLDVTRGVGGTGIVATLRNGDGGGSVGLRADMDALPIKEANDFAYRSQNEGRMHACGHDGHTSMLLGAAKYLAATRRFSGTVHFIFQPAEEGLGGARAMLEDGLFERFPCDAVFGMHNWPGLPVGEFAVRSGPMMAGGAFFDVDITGKGSHGARPEASVDPVVVASHVIAALQSIAARNVSPRETVVLSVTQVHAGDAYNVIPQTARLSGTVRAFSREVMSLVEQRMRDLTAGIAEGFGARAELDFRTVFAPTVNDGKESEFAAGICSELVGAERVRRGPPLIMASEDFSFMLEQVPGCYVNVGNGTAGSEVHNPGYDFNDDALVYGASFYARLVERRLSAE